MSSNFGTSRAVKISGQNFTLLKGFTISNVIDSGDVSSPYAKDTADYNSVENFIGKYNDFAFTKICRPLYGDANSLARYTGLPANNPDHIADFHFIGLMRSIDAMLMPKYSGYIDGTWGTVTASGATGTPSS